MVRKKSERLTNPEIIAKVFAEIQKLDKPVTIGYLVRNKALDFCYTSLNNILLNMVIKGKLKRQETTGEPIFWIPGTIPAFQEQPDPK